MSLEEILPRWKSGEYLLPNLELADNGVQQIAGLGKSENVKQECEYLLPDLNLRFPAN